jgi:hypothetical protein
MTIFVFKHGAFGKMVPIEIIIVVVVSKNKSRANAVVIAMITSNRVYK